MEATVVELRYHMNEVLKALDRNESVSVLYHGKIKGVICPAGKATAAKVVAHGFFGCRGPERPVEQIMGQLRGGRHRDL
jgi:tRNA (Thr-GGU) A37 N-methylase